MMTLTQIEEDGRIARERGQNVMQNPYFLRENMPSRTGESFNEWQDKIYHWDMGWTAADRIAAISYQSV